MGAASSSTCTLVSWAWWRYRTRMPKTWSKQSNGVVFSIPSMRFEWKVIRTHNVAMKTTHSPARGGEGDLDNDLLAVVLVSSAQDNTERRRACRNT